MVTPSIAVLVFHETEYRRSIGALYFEAKMLRG